MKRFHSIALLILSASATSATGARPKEPVRDPWSIRHEVAAVKFHDVTVKDALLALANDSGLHFGITFFKDAPLREKRFSIDLKDTDTLTLLDHITWGGEPVVPYLWTVVVPYPRALVRGELIEVWPRPLFDAPGSATLPLDTVLPSFEAHCATPAEALQALADQVTKETGWKVLPLAPALEDEFLEPLTLNVSAKGEKVRGILAKIARKTDCSWIAEVDTANKSMLLVLGREFVLPIAMENNYTVTLK